MVVIRQFREADTGTVWAFNALPSVGATADPNAPLPLPPSTVPPAETPDLIDVHGSYILAGGDFLVAELGGHLVGVGGVYPYSDGTAEILRVVVHPATRRRGIGRALVTALEKRAVQLGAAKARITTATNQPEAMAFFRDLGYEQVGRERQTGWSWTLVHFAKAL